SGSKDYTGSKAGTTECGSVCRYCNTSCSSGSTSYSGSVVDYNECGNACRSCSTSCPSGTSTSNPGGCGGSTTNECGTKTCYYPYQSCCNSYSSNWCSVHSTCHGDCCTDGTLQSCDPQCGGSGCGGGGGGGSSCYSFTGASTTWSGGWCFLDCSYTGGNYNISRACWKQQDWCDWAADDHERSNRCPSTLCDGEFNHSYSCSG
ncbi:MAG: hypothetical protein SO314_07065, partial [Alphaproteobacteria bacterium]|nr:hypothetical protein [Alphaproteobacteria bacterium]